MCPRPQFYSQLHKLFSNAANVTQFGIFSTVDTQPTFPTLLLWKNNLLSRVTLKRKSDVLALFGN